MNKSRFVLALVFMIVLLLTTVAIVSGGQEKVAVCHITGTHDFGDDQGEVPIGHVITIAEPAYQSHLDHGDPEVWCIDRLPDGTEVCKPGNQPKRVFVTSVTYQGNLGGLDGADSKCNQLALDVGLPGTYKAWLSTVSICVSDRLSHSTSPYILVNGDIVADDWSDLTDGTLQSPINVKECGTVVDEHEESDSAWTNTLTCADCMTSDCDAWNSSDASFRGFVGFCMDTHSMWTEAPAYEMECNRTKRLYCIQQ